jgi:adenylate cyclase class 2
LKETYEVEVKLPVANKDAIRKSIIEAGGVELNTENQIDAYYDHPCRSFSETDESVRIRTRRRIRGPSITESGHAPIEITYKGPKVDKKTKTRTEYTVNLSDDAFEPMSQILENTGFKHVANIVKDREFFDIDGITASLDVVTDVGCYIEFELIAEGRDSMKQARERILDLIRSLGLDDKNSVRESYLELYLNRIS